MINTVLRTASSVTLDSVLPRVKLSGFVPQEILVEMIRIRSFTLGNAVHSGTVIKYVFRSHSTAKSRKVFEVI